MRRHPLIPTALALTLGGLLFGLSAHHPAARAAPAAAKTASTMADLLNGKLYPNTLKRADLTPAYHFITLIDGQGKPAECATKGDVVNLSGETFLVAYILIGAPKPADAGADTPAPPDAQLTLINMHYVQALGNIRETPTPPPPSAPAPAPGTAAP